MTKLEDHWKLSTAHMWAAADRLRNTDLDKLTLIWWLKILDANGIKNGQQPVGSEHLARQHCICRSRIKLGKRKEFDNF